MRAFLTLLSAKQLDETFNLIFPSYKTLGNIHFTQYGQH